MATRLGSQQYLCNRLAYLPRSGCTQGENSGKPTGSKATLVCKGLGFQTNYDPQGLGIGGFGNLSGYTLEQVKDVPILSMEEALEYFDQVYEALFDCLTNMNNEALEQPPIGWPSAAGESPESVYVVLIMFLMDIREHLGEIKAIKAMWNRKCE